MKRMLQTLLLVCVMTAALAVTTLAADFDARAQELNDMGLFKGTEQGFDLDRAPTRGEATVMLVRLLGVEAEADTQYAAGEITNPFTDVPAWAAPHISWLYEQGLINGMGDGTFGTTQLCSAQHFCTLALRSLGYSDAAEGDFAYADALTFAQSKGLYDPMLFAGDFLRDDLVAISYQALATDVKDSEDSLLKTLVDSEAVSAEAAQPVLDKIAAYDAYATQTAAFNAATALDMDMVMKMSMAVAGETIDMDMTANAQVSLADRIQMAMTSTTAVAGESLAINMYIQNGTLYTQMGEEKVKAEAAAEELQALVDSYMTYTDAASTQGLYMVDAITSTTDAAGNTVYTITYGQALGSIAEAAGTMTGGAAVPMFTMDLGAMSTTITINADNVVTAMTIAFDMTMTAEGQTMTASCAADITINAVGDAVTVTFPTDLDTYTEAAEAPADVTPAA